MSAEFARVEALFLGAIEIADPIQRMKFLDEACAGDAPLKEHLAALLRAHHQPDSLLDQPIVASTEPIITRTHDVPAIARNSDGGDEEFSFLTPSQRPDSLGRIGNYEVLQVIGKGGFSIVFRVFDEVLQRVVALKALSPAMAVTSPARKRFLREARSAAAVRHENVVQVHAVEEQPLPFLVMEFIPGETLQQRIDRTGPLETAEVLQIGRQIAEGLAAAHATGLIHRDIKPSNILVDSGPNPVVKITDFGLARAVDDASLTRSGVVAGTPMYMAPEQAKGEPLDHRADLFSLGSVLYVMCTGRPPFRANSTPAVLRRVTEDIPRPIREIVPETPEWLCLLIEKLHAKDPANRFQTAREVADLLADSGANIKPRKVIGHPARPSGGKPGRLRKWVLIAAILLAPLLFFAIVTASYFFSQISPPRQPKLVDGPEINKTGAFNAPKDDGQDAPFNGEAANIKPLRDKVTAKEKELEAMKIRVEAGIATEMDFLASEAGVIEAGIQLAEAKRDFGEVKRLLQVLAGNLQRRRKLVAIRVEAGAASEDALHPIDAQIADVKARLAKEGVKPSAAP